MISVLCSASEDLPYPGPGNRQPTLAFCVPESCSTCLPAPAAYWKCSAPHPGSLVCSWSWPPVPSRQGIAARSTSSTGVVGPWLCSLSDAHSILLLAPVSAGPRTLAGSVRSLLRWSHPAGTLLINVSSAPTSSSGTSIDPPVARTMRRQVSDRMPP